LGRSGDRAGHCLEPAEADARRGILAGGIIQSTTAATMTLSLGVAYIELMKAIARAEIQGIQLSQKEMQEIFVREYQEYAGRRTQKNEVGIRA
jgi:hypothetical protein